MDAAVRVGGDVRGNRTPPRKGALGRSRRAEDDEIDVIGSREIEERAAGIGALDNVQRNPRRWKSERFHPMAQAHFVLEMPSRRGIAIIGTLTQRRSFHDRYAHQA